MDEKSMEQFSIVEKTEQAAKEHFRHGLNCAECVVQGFLDTHDTGMPQEVLALTTGFGGGIGRTKNLCGAISGAVMALGLVKGRRNPLAKETAAERIGELGEIYPFYTEMVQELEAHYGTLICRELCAPHGEFEGKARRKNCQEMVAFCAALAAKYAEK
jgi:C_GCAxxG_C_C family probable redox protein